MSETPIHIRSPASLLRPVVSALPGSELLLLVHRYRALLIEMTRRELTEQYAGQVFGAFWAIGHPLFQTGLLVFVFAFVFKTKIGGSYEMPLDYTTYLLAGLLPWIGFQQMMARTCTAMTSNAGLVKQVVFPIEILPLKSVFSSLVPQLLGLALLIAYVFVVDGLPPWTYLLLPVVIGLQIVAMIGVAFLLAAVGAFLRDLKDIVQVFATAGVYLMPVVYLPSWVPPLFKPIIYLNPFSYMVWSFQDTLYFGRIDHPWAWLAFIVGSLVTFVLGYRIFRQLKPNFGNVL